MRLLFEFHEGRVVSMFLENGFLEMCVKQGAEVMVISPGARYTSFIEKYGGPGISWIHLPPKREISRLEAYELRVGRWLSKRGLGRARQLLWNIVGEYMASAGAYAEKELLKGFLPDVVFTPHIAESFGRSLVAAARRMGITTVGNLASWDNTYRPLMSRPDIVTCWSEHNKDELRSRHGFRQEEVAVVGAPAFDPYFAPNGCWSRTELCARLGLEPTKPILLFASLGQFRPFMDETGTFAALLKALDDGLIRASPQIVLRLHPLSRATYFESFLHRDDVHISQFTGYIPEMMWAPTREEVILAGNILRHADVCISPGSTMTIESAIFDTPTVLPIVNLYVQETYERLFRRLWIESHFSVLVDKDWVPVVRTVEDLAAAINHALEDPDWYKNGRKAIRERILGPLDGRGTERIASVVINAARNRGTIMNAG